MTPGETAQLLTHAALLERSPAPDEATCLAWWLKLKAVRFEDAWAAMDLHFDESPHRLTIHDLLAGIMDLRGRWLRSHAGAAEIPPGLGRVLEYPEHIGRARGATAIGAR